MKLSSIQRCAELSVSEKIHTGGTSVIRSTDTVPYDIRVPQNALLRLVLEKSVGFPK